MKPQTDFVRWLEEWDWRRLARFLAWGLVAAAWSQRGPMELLHQAGTVLMNLALVSVLTLGLLTHLLALVVMAAVRLVLTLEDAAYALSERLVRPFLGSPFRPVSFLTALGVEMLLVLGAFAYCRAANLGPRLCAQLARVL